AHSTNFSARSNAGLPNRNRNVSRPPITAVTNRPNRQESLRRVRRQVHKRVIPSEIIILRTRRTLEARAARRQGNGKTSRRKRRSRASKDLSRVHFHQTAVTSTCAVLRLERR